MQLETFIAKNSLLLKYKVEIGDEFFLHEKENLYYLVNKTKDSKKRLSEVDFLSITENLPILSERKEDLIYSNSDLVSLLEFFEKGVWREDDSRQFIVDEWIKSNRNHQGVISKT